MSDVFETQRCKSEEANFVLPVVLCPSLNITRVKNGVADLEKEECTVSLEHARVGFVPGLEL